MVGTTLVFLFVHKYIHGLQLTGTCRKFNISNTTGSTMLRQLLTLSSETGKRGEFCKSCNSDRNGCDDDDDDDDDDYHHARMIVAFMTVLATTLAMMTVMLARMIPRILLLFQMLRS